MGGAAADGNDALRAACLDDDLALVLLDLTMPGLSGEETLRALQRIRGDVPVILTSGYDRTGRIESFRDGGVAGFLRKPYRPADLIRAARDVLDRPERKAS